MSVNQLNWIQHEFIAARSQLTVIIVLKPALSNKRNFEIDRAK